MMMMMMTHFFFFHYIWALHAYAALFVCCFAVLFVAIKPHSPVNVQTTDLMTSETITRRMRRMLHPGDGRGG